MADIFDTLPAEEPKPKTQDIFDQVEEPAAKGDIFDQVETPPAAPPPAAAAPQSPPTDHTGIPTSPDAPIEDLPGASPAMNAYRRALGAFLRKDEGSIEPFLSQAGDLPEAEMMRRRIAMKKAAGLPLFQDTPAPAPPAAPAPDLFDKIAEGAGSALDRAGEALRPLAAGAVSLVNAAAPPAPVTPASAAGMVKDQFQGLNESGQNVADLNTAATAVPGQQGMSPERIVQGLSKEYASFAAGTPLQEQTEKVRQVFHGAINNLIQTPIYMGQRPTPARQVATAALMHLTGAQDPQDLENLKNAGLTILDVAGDELPFTPRDFRDWGAMEGAGLALGILGEPVIKAMMDRFPALSRDLLKRSVEYPTKDLPVIWKEAVDARQEAYLKGASADAADRVGLDMFEAQAKAAKEKAIAELQASLPPPAEGGTALSTEAPGGVPTSSVQIEHPLVREVRGYMERRWGGGSPALEAQAEPVLAAAEGTPPAGAAPGRPSPPLAPPIDLPVGGGEPPTRGLVVASIGADGKIYYGEPGDLHFILSQKYPLAERGNWKDIGFAGPDGKFLTREEALQRVKEVGGKTVARENMPDQLDAADYRERNMKWSMARGYEDTLPARTPELVMGARLPNPPPGGPPAGGPPSMSPAGHGPGEGPPRAEFIGYNPPFEDLPAGALYNIRGAHPRTGSTVGVGTLRQQGIPVPETPTYEAWKTARNAKEAAADEGGGTFASPMRAPAPSRIQPSPIQGGEVKSLNDILLDVSKGLGRKVFFGKTAAREGGFYAPRTAATVIRYAGDLDTSAHELSHALDDKFGVVSSLGGGGNINSLDDELAKFWVHGSATESGPRSALSYKRAEGVAEFLRAWLVNPDEAAAAAPGLTRHVFSRLPAQAIQTLKTFSEDIRRFAGATAHEKIMANVSWRPPESGVLDWFSNGHAGPGFDLTWADKLKANWIDDKTAFNKAVDFARGEQGMGGQLPADDPQVLARLLSGVHAKMDDIFENGMVNGKNDRVTGPLKDIFAPLDASTKPVLDGEMRDLASYMIAQRSLEKIDLRVQRGQDVLGRRRDQLLDRLHLNEAETRTELERRQAEGAKELEDTFQRGIEESKAETRTRIAEAEKNLLARIQELKKPTTLKTADLSPARRGELISQARREKDALVRKFHEEHAARLAENKKVRDQDLAALKAAVEDRLTRVRASAGERGQEIKTSYAGAEGRMTERARAQRISGVGGGMERDYDVSRARVDEMKKDPAKLARIEEAAKRYRDWADANLRYLADTGRISLEDYIHIKRNNMQYVAMQRLAEVAPGEEAVAFGGRGAGGKLGGVSQPIKTFKGSSRTIVNPFTTLMEATYRTVREADRNAVMKSFRDLLVGGRGMGQGQPEALSEVGRQAKPGDKNTVKIFVNGKPEVWQFQDDVYKALKGIVGENVALPGWMTVLPRLVRASIVNFPPFLVRNALRDFQHRIVVSPESTIKDQLKLIGPMEIQNLKLFGGDQGGHYLRDRVNYMRAMDAAIKDLVKDKSTILAVPRKLAAGYQHLKEGSEHLGRVAEYRGAFRSAKAKGLDDYNAHVYAASKARGLMDFAVGGSIMRYINQMIPFSNASVQGLVKTARAGAEDPKGFALRWLLYAAAPSVAVYLWNKAHGDEEEYEQLPAYMKDLFYNIKVGPNLWLRIPKSFEIGVLSSGAQRLVAAASGEKRAFDGYAGSLARTLLPVDETALAGPFRGAIQAIANYDFFRQRRIVPPHEEKLAVELRDTSKASRLGQAIQHAVGLDARKADFLMREVFGFFGGFAEKLSDVGRPDRRGIGLEETGLFSQSPAFAARDVQWIMDQAAKNGLEGTASYKQVNGALHHYFNAKGDQAKDVAAAALMQRAAEVRDHWEKTIPVSKNKRIRKMQIEQKEAA